MSFTWVLKILNVTLKVKLKHINALNNIFSEETLIIHCLTVLSATMGVSNFLMPLAGGQNMWEAGYERPEKENCKNQGIVRKLRVGAGRSKSGMLDGTQSHKHLLQCPFSHKS